MSAGLAEKAQSAVIWSAGFNLYRDLLQFTVMLVLVRLLAPEAYGELGLVNSVIGFLGIFSFNNFIAYSLQVKNEGELNFQQHFTAGAVLQIGLFILTNVVGLVLRWSPKYAQVAPLVQIMSVTFLVEWPCETGRKMMERRFDWCRLRVLHAIGLLANAILAIIMALRGAGTLSLLVPGLVVTVPFSWELFIRQGWRPNWAWSWKAYKPAWEFGLTRIGSGLVLNGRKLLEAGVLSGVLGFATFGVLNRSFGLALLFCYRIAAQLMYAIYPVLTRVEGGCGNVQRVNGLVLRSVAWIVLPISVCLSVLARPAVQTVYGAKWLQVVSLLPWTLAWGAVAALVHAAYMLLLSQQQAKKCFLADAMNLVGTAICLGLALPHGIVAYLVGVASVQGILLTLLFIWLHQCQALSLRGIAEALAPAAVATTVAALGSTLLLRIVFAVEPNTFAPALTWGVAFLALYIGALRFAFAPQLTALVHHFPARRGLCRALAIPAVIE